MYFSGYLVAIERTKTWGVSPFFFFFRVPGASLAGYASAQRGGSVVSPEKVWLCPKIEHDYSTIICFGRWGSMLHDTIFRQQLCLFFWITDNPAGCHR
jgi:hypothetical protein